MNTKLKNLSFRKLKITDYVEFRKLFYLSFQKNLSFEFYKWRYFNDKFSFCYGAFDKKKLIANVGMASIQVGKKSSEIIYSRHSSMVLKNYRGLGIFSQLLNLVKKKFLKNIPLVFMWPNKNNFSNFGISRKNVIEKRFYLYKSNIKNKIGKKSNNYPIEELILNKKMIKSEKSYFYKDFSYFKKRYLSYRKDDYFLNKFQIKNLTSFFVLKKNKDKSGFNNVILDHFGSKKIYNKHLSYLKQNIDKLIFLSKNRRSNYRYKLIGSINVKIGFIKIYRIKQKRYFFSNKEIYLGDTDIFITI